MNGQKRKYINERVLQAPLLSFRIDKEIKNLRKESGWIEGDKDAITLQKSSSLRVVLISMHKGAILREHKVEGPITLFILSGRITFSADNDKINVGTNELIVLEKTIPHDVEALEDTTFILTIVQPNNFMKK